MPMTGKPSTLVQVAQSVLRMSVPVCLPASGAQNSSSPSWPLLQSASLSADQSRWRTAALR